MEGLFQFLSGLIQGWDGRRRWFALLGLVALAGTGLFAYEAITGANFYGTLERRIAILKEINSLSTSSIRADPDLNRAYLDILRDLNARPTVLFLFPYIDLEISLKALSAASIWIIALILAAFGSFGTTNRAVGMVGFAIIAVFFGVVGALIPIMFAPWVNFFLFPLIQFGFLWLLSALGRRGRRSA